MYVDVGEEGFVDFVVCGGVGGCGGYGGCGGDGVCGCCGSNVICYLLGGNGGCGGDGGCGGNGISGVDGVFGGSVVVCVDDVDMYFFMFV